MRKSKHIQRGKQILLKYNFRPGAFLFHIMAFSTLRSYNPFPGNAQRVLANLSSSMTKVIKGHQMDILQRIPMKEYSDSFTVSPPRLALGKTNPEALLQGLKMMQQKSIEILRSVAISELDSPLEPTPTPHPIARTKFEAIDWNIKHTMYHCGQIGILSRVVEKRFDFGLRVAE